MITKPFKDDTTKQNDRIIAIVYHQLFRWGFSSSKFERLIADAAFQVLDRGNKKELGDRNTREPQDILSTETIKKIYKDWFNQNKTTPSTRQWPRDRTFFNRIDYSKRFLCRTAPKEDHLSEVIVFFMQHYNYMDQKPEKIALNTPPKCPEEMMRRGIWWRVYDGTLDGDPELSPKAIKSIQEKPKVKIKKK